MELLESQYLSVFQQHAQVRLVDLRTWYAVHLALNQNQVLEHNVLGYQD